jgi:hypothetical protein
MVFLACLALAGTGSAQTAAPLQIQGTIQGVDCQTGAVNLATSSGTLTVQATNDTTASVNGSAVSLCSLESYAGDQATATLYPSNSEFVLSQVAVSAPQAAAPAPASKSSAIGVAVGAILLGGIIGYLLGHNNPPAPGPDPAPAYDYQGHHYYYRCANGGWSQDRACR